MRGREERRALDSTLVRESRADCTGLTFTRNPVCVVVTQLSVKVIEVCFP